MKKILYYMLSVILMLSVSVPVMAADPYIDSLAKADAADSIFAARTAVADLTMDQLENIYSKTENDFSKEAIIERLRYSSDKKMAAQILKYISSNDKPKFSQLAYIDLYLMGHTDSLEGLTESTDQFGTFRYESGSFPWTVMKAAEEKYPDSFLSKGIKEYENITGKPYFMIDLPDPGEWLYAKTYGDGAYKPDVEITQLLDFLNKYSAHPAADDAAYRLGRNYEIRGNYPSALKYLYNSAEKLPDGDGIRYDAQGRIMYILDAAMDADALQYAMKSGAVPEQIKPCIEYTAAVKAARGGDYAKAAAGLKDFVKQYRGQAIYGIEVSESDSFWNNIFKQEDMYDQLTDLKQKGDVGSLYSAAALIYKNEDIFYNNIWSGERQAYMWMGHMNEVLTKESGAYKKYFLSFNNFGQALSIYQDLSNKNLTPELTEKTDYNIALCYSHLMDYSQEVTLLGLYDGYKEKAIESFKNFVAAHPDSTMADDALYALGHIAGDDSYFSRILKEYPNSDMAQKAANEL